MTTKQKERTKITTPESRLSYPTLFQAKVPTWGGDAKFSLVQIFRVKETAASKAAGEKVVDIEPIKAAIRKVLAEALGGNWQEEIKRKKDDGSPVYRLPLRDGNSTEKKDIAGFGEGTVFLTASSKMKPGVVDSVAGADGRPKVIDVPTDVYGGCYGRTTLSVFYYDKAGNKGVSFGLQNVQKLRDGEPLGSKAAASDDFDAIAAPGGDAAGASGNGSDLGI